ncbi:uncharacterized protein LOC119328065 [Triticum dicoccoides]|uniref:uncharacterized protein LOC119328065 n=1 Tax=Triticum dicoccoides TaxID=85692 RepID=UPI0018910ED0|nr:uncharacterized protein LOC119328065 [Triticum dicoccoides]
MSPPSSPDEEAPSSPEEQERPSSRAMSLVAATREDSQWHRRNQQGHKITRIVAASEDMGAAIASEYVSTHSHHHLRGCESHLSLRGCAYHLRVREFYEYTPRAGIPFQ